MSPRDPASEHPPAGAALLRSKARELLERQFQRGAPAPDFGEGASWLNVSRAPSVERDLRGRLVLLHFWSYGCLRCQQVLRDLVELEQQHAGAPLAVVGVHSARYPAERERENVRQALLRAGVDHPVVLDDACATLPAFGVRAWPTVVALAPDGRVIGAICGAGQRAVLEALVATGLEFYAERGALDPRPLPLRPERATHFPRPLCFPGHVLAERALGRLWIADSGHHRIVECDLAGRFLRAFGSGRPGRVDGSARTACFRGPQGLALERGALIVADTLNHALRRIDLDTGEVTTLAGDGQQGFERSHEMAASEARLDAPWGVAAHAGEFLVALSGAHQIWSLDEARSTLRPVAGSGVEARADGEGSRAHLAQPCAIALWRRSVVFADSESSAIRRLDLETLRVTTVAGGGDDPRHAIQFGDEDGVGPGRRFQRPLGVATESAGEAPVALAYVADTYNDRLKLLDLETGAVSSYAGDGQSGWRDGPCESARFWGPSGLSLCEGALYVADTSNHAVRAVDLDDHEVRTLDLSSVPLPQTPTAAIDLESRELPRLPGVVDHGARKLRLPARDGALVLRLALGDGESLAAGAPSQYRVLRIDGLTAARQVAGRLESPAMRVELGVAGDGSLRVQVLAYIRDRLGDCRLSSHELRLDVVLDERAPARDVGIVLAREPRS